MSPLAKLRQMKSYVSAGDGLDELVGDFGRAHLRLQVIDRHRRARHEDAVLALVRGFAAAVEEEGDVGVLFGFGDAKLPEALGGDPFADRVDDVFLREEDVQALVGRVVWQSSCRSRAGSGSISKSSCGACVRTVVSSLARSLRKLTKTTASWGLMRPIALPCSSARYWGSRNSSVIPWR